MIAGTTPRRGFLLGCFFKVSSPAVECFINSKIHYKTVHIPNQVRIIVDLVIICTRFEETGNELPYYERGSGKEQVYK